MRPGLRVGGPSAPSVDVPLYRFFSDWVVQRPWGLGLVGLACAWTAGDAALIGWWSTWREGGEKRTAKACVPADRVDWWCWSCGHPPNPPPRRHYCQSASVSASASVTAADCCRLLLSAASTLRERRCTQPLEARPSVSAHTSTAGERRQAFPTHHLPPSLLATDRQRHAESAVSKKKPPHRATPTTAAAATAAAGTGP